MLALTLFEELGFEPSTQLAALESTRWPGRMERLDVPGLQAPIYLSGDHNPQGMESLLELLRYYPRQRLRVFAAVAKDKDAQAVLGPLLDLPDAEVTLTRTPFKGTDPALLPLSVRSKAAYLDADLERAWEKCLNSAKPGDVILVTGSLYLVGWVRARFTADRGFSQG
jgi:dihydrofolate synthase/folylpolyglutamate synthase